MHSKIRSDVHDAVFGRLVAAGVPLHVCGELANSAADYVISALYGELHSRAQLAHVSGLAKEARQTE